MTKTERDDLSKWRAYVLSDYLEEMARANGMEKVNFKVKQACSCCGETGYVPEHHKFLCVFCWVSAPFFAQESFEVFDTSEGPNRAEGRGIDKVNTNVPASIEGIHHDETPSDILIYNAKNFSQDELQAMIP